ncbi:MAG TPA: GNAT family N-acetyltransferase [Actinocrinis sp.]|nr:GNAT family N-acetyltransferase [Actinocrinis sp.]
MTTATACAPAPATGPAALPDWCDLVTRAGRFTLAPVRPDRDLWRLHRWLNDPVVDEYWQLAGDLARVDGYLAEQRSRPHTRGYVARLSGRAIGYWELYRAADDRLGGYYPARPTDLGVHLLIGEADCRGIGLGAVLLEALAESLQHGTDLRLVSEPDERNLPSVRAFTRAGFRRADTIALPEKNAALMVRDPAEARRAGRAPITGPGRSPRPSADAATPVGVPPRPRRTAEGLIRRGD